MRLGIALILLTVAFGCSKHDMDMEGLAEEVMKKKEGIEIQMKPIEEQK